jgi:hypothetical protein
MTTLRCDRCGLRITPGHEDGGWATSGPGSWYHADRDECGPPLPELPLPEPHPVGGEWPTDQDITRLLNHETGH